MRNLIKSIGVLAVSGVLLAGCAATAHIEKDKTVDLSNYRSFAWVDTRESRDTAKTKVSDLTERTIKEAVNDELGKAGWTASKKPDILLTYDVLVERSVREEANPVYSQPFARWYFNPYTRRYVPMYYPSQFWGYDREQRPVREGTITVRMIDSKTDKTIWQGWATDEVASRNLTGKEIRNGIKSIFRKFDVARN